MHKPISIDKGSRPSKLLHVVVDQIIITPAIVKEWEIPGIQRGLKVNDKVKALAKQLPADHGVLPGTIILGKVNNVTYLVDGQQRRNAFLLSGCEDGACITETYHCESLSDLGEIFARENSRLVPMRPDDYLRAMEGSIVALQKIRTACPFVGYSQSRRSDRSPMISMTTALRSWCGSNSEVPSGAVPSAIAMAESLDEDGASQLIDVLSLCHAAWGLDPEYQRLWNNLNLIITVWLYRRTVIHPHSSKTTVMDKKMFLKCLAEMSADRQYLDWLHGRKMDDRGRAPCFGRVKVIFARRIYSETGKRAQLPSPPWAHGMAIYKGRPSPAAQNE